MATSFFNGNFFGGEFFNAAVEAPAPAAGGGGARYRYFTPIPPPLKGRAKRQVDRLVEQEARIKQALVKYETSGADIAVLDELARKLREIQLTILRLALESALVAQYIEWKRQQEDEDIAFIMTLLI